MKELAARSRSDEEEMTIHVKCANGHMTDRYYDSSKDLNKSTICFSDETAKTHCHHIIVRGSVIGLKNVRWPSERKFKVPYHLIVSCSNIFLFL